MSYILDALRRAESERERGQVPGLHAQPAPVGLGEGPGARLPGHIGLVAGGVATLLLIGGAVWWWSRPAPAAATRLAEGAAPTARESRPAAEPTSAPAAATTPSTLPLLVAPPAPPAPPAPHPSPAAAPQPQAQAPAPRAPVATPAELAPAADVSPPAGAPAGTPATPAPPAAAAATRATPATAGAAPAPQPVPPGAGRVPPVVATDATAPVNAGAAGGTKVIPLAELPSAQRAELPQMLVGGSIYSDQPSRRFVVINGLVVREGETAAPGVTLERIAPKSAVIRWRDLRIELPI